MLWDFSQEEEMGRKTPSTESQALGCLVCVSCLLEEAKSWLQIIKYQQKGLPSLAVQAPAVFTATVSGKPIIAWLMAMVTG